jgi:hypothetical protein
MLITLDCRFAREQSAVADLGQGEVNWAMDIPYRLLVFNPELGLFRSRAAG